ncbi:MAG: hypothetical protein PHS30_07140 [Bacteroidales bacterium]|nr:hypothetical protein [Bacteroidales bacterium]
MNKLKILGLSMLVLPSIFVSCAKEDAGPIIADYPLNYEIPEIPVTKDYTVGAFYFNFTSWTGTVTSVPVVWPYTNTPTGIPAGVMQQHIDQAKNGGLDFFIFSVRSLMYDANSCKSDTVLINSFTNASNTNDMKFAVSFTFDKGKYNNISTTKSLESQPAYLANFYKDVTFLAKYFSKSNYMKVGGKYLLYIKNASFVYADNDSTIYANIRSQLSALGYEVFLVGGLPCWEPPARYLSRYYHCFDALYHENMLVWPGGYSQWDRFMMFYQFCNENWKYSKNYFEAKGVGYQPNISPAHNYKIANASSTNPNVLRGDEGKFFRTYCNIAKMNADTSRIILVDSWNNWAEDTQLEPNTIDTTFYLDILKQQFKVLNR